MAWNKEEDLKLKYAYVDGESNPRYKKKAKKKTVRKANHKHEWCNCTIETTYPQNYGIPKLNGQPTKLMVSYCPVCGKVNYRPQIDKHVARRLPKGASLWSYRVDDTEKMKKLREWYDEFYPHFSVPSDKWFNAKGARYIDMEELQRVNAS